MKRNLGAIVFATAVVLFFVVPSIAGFYTDWLWFHEMDMLQVFLRSISARLTLGAVAFLAAFAVLFLNMRLAQGALKERAFTVFGPQGPRTIAVDLRRFRVVFQVGAVIVAALIALYASTQWQAWLMARHAVPFGTVDPILGRDVSFYTFQLPFLQFLHKFAFITVLVSALGVAAAHLAGQSLVVDQQRGLIMSAGARRHLSILIAILLLLLAFRAWLGIPDLLITSSGTVYGASYVDVHARMPTQWILIVAALAGAGLALYQITQQRFWPLLSAAGLYFGVSVLGLVYALVLQRFVVSPNEQVRETPYIANSIAATRAGFALDKVEERPMSGEAPLTLEDIQRNAATLDNVPLWDERPLLDTFGQIQEIRTYYDFASVHNDRYMIDGKYRQIMLSAREMNFDFAAEHIVDQRKAHLHPRLRHHPRPGERGHARGPAGVVHQGPAAGVIRRSQGDPACDLLRRAVQRSRVREDRHR